MALTSVQYEFLESCIERDNVDVSTKNDDTTTIEIVLSTAFSNGLDITEQDAREFLYVMTGDAPRWGLSFDKTKTVRYPFEATTVAELAVENPEAFIKLQTVANKARFGVDEACMAHEVLGIATLAEWCAGIQASSDAAIELVRAALKRTRREWFDAQGNMLENLAKDPSLAHSKEFWMLSDTCKENVLRRERAAKSALERKKQKIAAVKARRKTVMTAMDEGPKSELLGTLIHTLLAADFDELKKLITPSVSFDGVRTWIGSDVFSERGLTASDLPHIEHYVLNAIRAAHPDWFDETEDGSLRLKRAIPRAKKRGMDRITRALYRALEKLVIKNGKDKVIEILETVPASLSPSTGTTPQ